VIPRIMRNMHKNRIIKLKEKRKRIMKWNKTKEMKKMMKRLMKKRMNIMMKRTIMVRKKNQMKNKRVSNNVSTDSHPRV